MLGAVVSILALSSCSMKPEPKPNIIFIMSDDHCAQAIGAYGERLASLNPTPTIDRLAREGMLFENAFCTNS
ncbi:MAG: acetylglucosamine-6-sulfatase, partial [Calditrichaeota bacterium]